MQDTKMTARGIRVCTRKGRGRVSNKRERKEGGMRGGGGGGGHTGARVIVVGTSVRVGQWLRVVV